MGTAFAETFTLPVTVVPQTWFVVDAEATFWMARFPAIVGARADRKPRRTLDGDVANDFGPGSRQTPPIT